VRWIPRQVIKGVPYETPLPGFRVDTCNTLRLWSAQACESFDFQAFNLGDYYAAVEGKVFSENITKVLYPNDASTEGKQLRLEQQYFFVSCSLQDMIRAHVFLEGKLDNFHQRFAAQLNDTHPSIGVAELMRLLVDEYDMDWDKAWHITRHTFAYTNHTLLPEALEKWPLALFRELLPRHLEIIYEINRRFLGEVRLHFPDDLQRLQRLSLIDEAEGKYVRMANLACVGSHAINGVAELHSELLKREVLSDFYALAPEKFHNVTNGVTPRRFLALINPRLIFGGKAAPGYFIAKLIIKLINSVGEVVNRDPDVRERLKVVFVPDYNVKNSRKIYPAADLSEQISTAGKEASGTGNMKFSMNGANIEIREEVGAENFFLFGLTAEEAGRLKAMHYNPQDYYRANAELRAAIDLIDSGRFSQGDSALFKPLTDSLLYRGEVPAICGLSSLPRLSGRSRPCLLRSRTLDADEHSERRAQRKIFFRPGDQRILRKNMAGKSREKPGLIIVAAFGFQEWNRNFYARVAL
jgi:glucan phosphorylase